MSVRSYVDIVDEQDDNDANNNNISSIEIATYHENTQNNAMSKLITCTDLQELHEQQLLNGKSNEEHIIEIVDIICSIEQILLDYSSSDSHIVINDTNNGNKDKFAFVFDVNDTYLSNPKYATIKQLTNNKITSIIMIIILLILSFMYYIIPNNKIYLITELILRPIFIIYIIILLLDLNHKAMKYIFKSFEFWFKFLYVLSFVISWYWYYYFVNSDSINTTWTIQYTMNHFCSVLLIVLYSSLDASRWKPWTKFIIGIIISIIVSLYALRLTFTIYINNIDDSIVTVFRINQFQYKISLLTYQTNSIRILVIFLWRQTVMSYYRGYKCNQCILLKVSPFVQWFNYKHNNSKEFLIEVCSKIGGIDMIISDKINTFNQTQIDSMYKLFNTEMTQKIQKDMKSNKNMNKEMSVRNKMEPPTYYFKIDNTYLHCIFGIEMAGKIINILWSNICIGLLLLLAIIYVFLSTSIYNSYSTNLIFRILMNIIVIPWLILSLLSCNVCSLRLILKTFEFWFKLLTVFMVGMVYFLSKYYLNYEKTENVSLNICSDILMAISGGLSLIIVSLFDALNMKHKNKLIGAIIYSFMATTIAIYMQLLILNDKNFKHILILTDGITISLYAIQISSIRVLAIFGWKQCWHLKRKGNLKCIFIKCSPYITWINQYNKHIQQSINMN